LVKLPTSISPTWSTRSSRWPAPHPRSTCRNSNAAPDRSGTRGLGPDVVGLRPPSPRDRDGVRVKGIDDDAARFRVTFNLAVNRDAWNAIEAMAQDGERSVASLLKRMFKSQVRLEHKQRQRRIEEAKKRAEASEDQEVETIEPRSSSAFGSLVAQLH
jgi:hypothetical protein